MTPRMLARAERLTLAVLMCGVASLALSDFVSPVYWALAALAALLRLFIGPKLALSELQASLLGWGGFFWVGAELLMGRAPVVAFTDFLLILSVAVTIEAATPRNHLHRMLVGLFLLLGAAVLTDSVLYIVPVTAFLWFMWRAAACLYGLNWPGGDLAPLPPLRDVRVMPAIVLATAGLFVVLPRFEVQSLLKPTQPRMETSGFSDRVQLGDFARKLDPTVVLRIEPLSGDPDRVRRLLAARYWRGVALGRFAGSGWERLREPVRRYAGRGRDLQLAPGDGFRVAVYREASDHPYIELPEGVRRIHDIPQPVKMDGGGALRFDHAPSRRLRLIMDIDPHAAQLPELLPPQPDERDTRVVPQAVKSWVASLSRPEDSPAQTLQRVVDELRGWQYDLNAPIDAAHPVASFLRQRRGHCELYATALALAARSLGFPARVVNGYFGGEWNEVGHFMVIRQQHAHSWVEVWQGGAWRRLDATPATRWVITGVRFHAFDEIWESVRLSWYRYVLEFQNADRRGLVNAIWQGVRRYAGLAVGLLIAGLLLGAGIRGLYRLLQRNVSLQSRLDRWLRANGVDRRPWQPLRMLNPPAGVDAGAWQVFVHGWEAQAYGGSRSWNRAKLRRELRALSVRHC